MSADSYMGWVEKTATRPTCTMCGWIGPEIPGTHADPAVRRAFYAHFYASCVICAAAGDYDEGDDVGPHTAAALLMLEVLSKPCEACAHRNGWCEHRQPPLPHQEFLYSWAQAIPEWAR